MLLNEKMHIVFDNDKTFALFERIIEYISMLLKTNYQYNFNKVDYGYSQPLINIVEKELQVLLNRIDKGLLPFNSEVVLSDYAIYCNLKEQAKRKARKKLFKKKEMSEE